MYIWLHLTSLALVNPLPFTATLCSCSHYPLSVYIPLFPPCPLMSHMLYYPLLLSIFRTTSSQVLNQSLQQAHFIFAKPSLTPHFSFPSLHHLPTVFSIIAFVSSAHSSILPPSQTTSPPMADFQIITSIHIHVNQAKPSIQSQDTPER